MIIFILLKEAKCKQRKFLPESEIPRQWYNIQADMPTPLEPPLNPATGEPIGPEALSAIFPMPLIEQEVSHERWIDIPEEVLEKLLIWRPTPLYRAYDLENTWKHLQEFTIRMRALALLGVISRLPL